MPEESRYVKSSSGMQQAWKNAKLKKKPKTSMIVKDKPQARLDRRDRGRRRQVTVKPGEEDLLSLSKRYGVSPEDIARANRGVLTYRRGIRINLPNKRDKDFTKGKGETPIQPLPTFMQDLTAAPTYPDEGRYTQQYTGIATAGRRGSASGSAPIGPWSVPGSGSLNIRNRNTADYRYGYENELIYQRQLVKTEENIRLYDQYPDYLSDRMAGSLGFSAQELIDLGYVRDGNYWVATEQIGGLPDAASAGPSGYGSSGYGGGYGGGYGYGGGGGGGGGGRTPSERLPYYALESGTPVYSQSGRMFDVGSLGLIHWRLG